MPCDDAQCFPLTHFRASVSSGWLWTDDSIKFLSYRIWDAKGLSDELNFTSSSAGFYDFTPGKGDAMLFMKDSSHKTYAACIQEGLTLNESINYFADAFRWESNSELPCIKGE
jgi:hypothetical protein